MNKRIIKDNSGVVLIILLLVISTVLFLTLYFLEYSLSEKKIAKTQVSAVKTYYLAEAGINEMYWLIKNDPVYSSNFESDPSWSATTTRIDPFGPNSGSYTVSITNSSEAHGEILSTGYYDVGNGSIAQRVVRTYVYKAIGQSGVGNNAGYADGNINISASIVNFHDGSAHSNNNFVINNSSVVHVYSDLNAVGNYINNNSTITIDGDIHASNYAPAAIPIDMPAIDFNSTSTESLKNLADIVYTSSDFDDLLKDNQNLTLNDPITYVTGDVELKGGQILTVNGLLVVEGDFIVGFKNNFGSRTGPSNLYINHTSGQKSGVFASRHVEIKQYTGDVDVKGVIYANDQLNVVNLSASANDFEITGGLVSRKLTITSCTEPIEITHDNNILVDTLGAASSSQTIIVEHWEEEY